MTQDQQKYHFSSAAQDWETPQYIFDALAVEFGFTVDAAADKDNAKCKRYWSAEDDGLAKDWTDEVVWLNPPYGKGITTKWVAKAYRESKRGVRRDRPTQTEHANRNRRTNQSGNPQRRATDAETGDEGEVDIQRPNHLQKW